MRWVCVGVWIASLVAATPAQARPVQPSAWPAPLSVSLSTSLASNDLREVRFRDPTRLVHRSGAQLALSNVGFVGAEGVLTLAARVVRFSVGFAYHVPRAGELEALPTFEPGLRAATVRRSEWLAELGLGHRFGDFTPFLALRASAVRTVVVSSVPELSLRSVRLWLGPRLGFRAHLRGRLFVQAAAGVNLRGRPDPAFTVGLGVGER